MSRSEARRTCTRPGPSHIARQTSRAGAERGRARCWARRQQIRLAGRCELAARSGACLGCKTWDHGCEEHAGGQGGLVASGLRWEINPLPATPTHGMRDHAPAPPLLSSRADLLACGVHRSRFYGGLLTTCMWHLLIYSIVVGMAMADSDEEVLQSLTSHPCPRVRYIPLVCWLGKQKPS